MYVYIMCNLITVESRFIPLMQCHNDQRSNISLHHNEHLYIKNYPRIQPIYSPNCILGKWKAALEPAVKALKYRLCIGRKSKLKPLLLLRIIYFVKRNGCQYMFLTWLTFVEIRQLIWTMNWELEIVRTRILDSTMVVLRI